MPSVQNKLAREVVGQLSQTLGTEVQVDRVRVKFFSAAVIEGLLILDRQRDTLLSVEELSADIGFFSLLQQRLFLDNLQLHGAYSHIQRSAVDSSFNYQFILDRFKVAPPPAAPTDTSQAAAWSFGISQLNSSDIRLHWDDQLTQTHFQTGWEAFLIEINRLDLDEQAVDMNQMVLDAPYFRMSSPLNAPDTSQTSPAAPLQFPNLGWQLTFEQFILTQGQIGLTSLGTTRRPDFDHHHLDIQALELKVEQFEWSANALQAQLTQLALQEQSGLEISSSQADIELDSQSIRLVNFRLQTPYSQIQNSTELKFNAWADLPDILNSGRWSTQFEKTYITPSDQRFFHAYLPPEVCKAIPLIIDGRVDGQAEKITLEQLQLQYGKLLKLQASGDAKHILEPEQLDFKLHLDSARIDFLALRARFPELGLPRELDSLGQLTMDGKIQGGLHDLQLQDLRLHASESLTFVGSGQLQNLDDIERLQFNLNIDQLNAHLDDISALVPTTLPAGVQEMQYFDYRGNILGTLHDLTSQGQLSTDIGYLTTNLKVQFNQDYTDAIYKGDFTLAELQLGRLLSDTSQFDLVSLTAEVDGKGLQADQLNLAVDAQIDSIDFNGYCYHNLAIDGTVDRLKYQGEARIQDDHLAFDFRGLVDLNQEQPVLQFDLALDTLDTQALHLSEQIIRASTQLKGQFIGGNIDDFMGRAALEGLALSNGEDNYQLDSLVLYARKKLDTNKRIELNSPLLAAQINGDFRLLQLPDHLLQYFNDYFSLDELMATEANSDSLNVSSDTQSGIYDQDLAFSFLVKNPVPLTKLFFPQLQRLKYIEGQGRFNTEEQALSSRISIPELAIMGWQVDSLQWRIQGDAERITTALNFASLNNGSLGFTGAKWQTVLGNQKLKTNIQLEANDQVPSFIWGAELSSKNSWYQLQLDDSLHLAESIWQVPSEHLIRFQSEELQIQDFSLNNGEQSIEVATYDHPINKNYTPIGFVFKNFQIKEISDFTNIDGFRYSGLFNGNITLNDVRKNLHYFADLELDQLTVNDSLIGDINLKAEQNEQQPLIDFAAQLSGPDNAVQIQGNYHIPSTQLAVQADIERLPMILIDPFTFGGIKNSSGYLTGQFTVKGTTALPETKGTLAFMDASTKVDYLKTRYKIKEHPIQFDDRTINFGQLQLEDPAGKMATLSGRILHDRFQNIQLDLDFSTKSFQFLNTGPSDNDLFYGTLNLAAQMRIQGPAETPIITITAKSLAPSKLTVSAAVEEDLGGTADYIIYGRPGQRPLDSLIAESQSQVTGATGLDLSLNLDLGPEAELIVIVDPLTGDQLNCRGEADLSIRMFPSGAVNVTGLYTVSEGAYQFNYQGLVKRAFDIKAGSRLNFIGDPLDTRFDITAAYKTRTSIYPLIANESSLSTAAAGRARELRDVSVLMNMKGDINEPSLSFDIDAEIDDIGLSSLMDQKLIQLREDESELNKQVFGLLLLNSFVADQSTSTSLSTAGENIALSSVSGLISNQLNRLSERYLDGLGLTFDLESYRGQFGADNSTSTRTNLNVGLTRSVFNDRLTVKVGGVVQLDSSDQTAADGSSLNNIAGDFVLEYKLDPNGNYVLRAFQRTDYDAFDNSNVNKTGVGIKFNKSFGQ